MDPSATFERIAFRGVRVARRRALELQRWIPRVSAAVADQGLFTGTSFAVNLVLARWLETAAYGAFAAAYALFVLVGALYNAVLIEPMLFFGAERYRERFRPYLGGLIAAHGLATGAASLLLFLAGLALQRLGRGGDPPVVADSGVALSGAALALPFVLSTWLMRRACYVRDRPSWAAAASAVYLVTCLGGLYALVSLGELTVVLAFLVMGASGVLVSVLLAVVLRPAWGAGTGLRWSDLSREHWHYGKWLLSTSVFAWVRGNIYYLVLPGTVGLAGTAALRAIGNVVNPLYQGMVAVSTLLVPHFTSVARRRGPEALRKQVMSLMLLYAFAWAGGWMVLVFVREPLLRFLYGGRYDDLDGLLLLMALTVLPGGIAYILGAAVRALERPDVVFRSYVVSTLVTVTFGVGLLLLGFGVAGAIVGGIGAASAAAVSLARFQLRSR